MTTASRDAMADLRRAVDRTLDADSFHLEVSSPSASSGSGATAAIDYHAPDRVRAVFVDGTESIVDAAGLEVERVKEPDATRQGEDVTLDITLLDADALRFDELAEAKLGGHLSIGGLTMDEAARVNAALT